MSYLGSRVLYPFWKSEGSNSDNKLQIPDYGNCGVTVEFKDELTLVQNGKYNLHPLAAKTVSLPFQPPNLEGFSFNDSRELTALNNARWKKKVSVYQKSLKTNSKMADELRDILKSLIVDKQAMMEVPKDVYALANDIPKEILPEGKHVDAVMHNGGGLYYHRLAEEDPKGLIIHTSGKYMEKMVILPVLGNLNDTRQSLLTAESERKVVREFNSKIYQVQTMKTSEKIFCGLRFGLKMELGLINEDRFGNVSPEFVKTAVENIQITHFALSPYVPGDYLYITASGEYTSCNMETTCTTCRTPLKLVGGLTGMKNWSLQYSSHPRCFICCCESDMIIKDLRRRQTSSLLNPNFGTLYPNEKLCTMLRSKNDYLHYVSTTQSLLLLDERFPGHPVLHWNHQMTGPPRLMSCVDYSSRLCETGEAVLLASRSSHDVVLFNIQKIDATRYCSLSPPLHISKPNDFIENLLLTNIVVDPTIRVRTELPLDGIAIVPTQSQGITILQMTSVGDLFYQDFYDGSGAKTTELGHRAGPGFTSGQFHPEMEQKVSEWVDDAFNSMVANSSNAVDPSSQIDAECLFKAMISLKPHAHGCPLCCFCDDAQKQVTDDSEICQSCGTNVKFSNQMTKTASEMGILAGNENGLPSVLPLPISVNDMKDSDDALMQRMTKEWIINGDLPATPMEVSDSCATANTEVWKAASSSSSGIFLSSNDSPPTKPDSEPGVLLDQDGYTGLASYFLEISHENESPVCTIDT